MHPLCCKKGEAADKMRSAVQVHIWLPGRKGLLPGDCGLDEQRANLSQLHAQHHEELVLLGIQPRFWRSAIYIQA